MTRSTWRILIGRTSWCVLSSKLGWTRVVLKKSRLAVSNKRSTRFYSECTLPRLCLETGRRIHRRFCKFRIGFLWSLSCWRWSRVVGWYSSKVKLQRWFTVSIAAGGCIMYNLYSRHGSTDNVLIGESVIIRMKSTFGLITKVFYLYCGMIVTGFEIKNESWIMCSRSSWVTIFKKPRIFESSLN